MDEDGFSSATVASPAVDVSARDNVMLDSSKVLLAYLCVCNLYYLVIQLLLLFDI